MMEFHPRTRKGHPPPKNNWRCQGKLQPLVCQGRSKATKGVAGNEITHGDQHERHRESSADPETTLHVDEFRIRLLRDRSAAPLEGHTAKRTRTGCVAENLGVHGACVGGGFARASDVVSRLLILIGWCRVNESSRVIPEQGPAVGAAKHIGVAVMHVPVERSWEHLHPAYEILSPLRCGASLDRLCMAPIVTGWHSISPSAGSSGLNQSRPMPTRCDDVLEFMPNL